MRDDFTKATAEHLAKRAGHVCSNPDCRAKTSGPSEADPTKSKNVGVAAHISAASDGGPRFNALMSSDHRKAPENGIWLCSTCAHLIDTNGGIDHPIATLQKWKTDHEAETSRALGKAQQFELSGTIEAEGIGEVTGADIQKPTKIAPGTFIRAAGIGKVTGAKIGGKDG
jgi:hypothetical protein